jgi:hypothetical protein
MNDPGRIALHWRPDENRWAEIDWDDFLAFREWMVPFRPLPGVEAGIHYFAVCIFDDVQTWNLIPHKYLVAPSGKIGRDNFYGWNREERADYDRLMVAREYKPGDQERLYQIRDKAGDVMYPPRESLYALVRALPHPPRLDSGAMHFLDTVAAKPYQQRLERAS